MNTPCIHTIIVTYNPLRWIDKCLSSLIDSLVPTEIVVVDNGSTDGSIQYIKEKFRCVILIENSYNMGFAKANNVGIDYSLKHGADYVFLLNQDAWIERETLSELLICIKQDERVGIVSPLHLTGDNITFDKLFLAYMSEQFHEDLKRTNLAPSYQVEYVNAAAWLMSVDMLKEVGGFDTLLFLHYGEDENLCQRVLYFKWKIFVCSSTTICHDRALRTSQKSDFRNGVLGQRSYEIDAKVELGNINKKVNLIYYAFRHLALTFFWFFLFQFKRSLFHYHLLRSCPLIIESRKINKTGGLIWI